MASNLRQKYSLTIVFCIFCLLTYGQNIKKHYLAKPQEKGNIYHFLPISLYADTDGEKLSYDLTYTSWNDSITMNFTFTKSEPLLIDSINYVSSEVRIEGIAEKLYVEPTTKKWVHRYSFKTKADGFFQLYSSTSAIPEIRLYAKGKEYCYYANKSGWRKYVPIGQKIVRMIRL